MRHCPRCQAEFEAERPQCSDCGAALVDGPSPRFDATVAHQTTARPTGVVRGGFTRLATVRGSAAASALGDLLIAADVVVAWGDGQPPAEDGDAAASFALDVATEDVERARDVLAEWADPDVLVSDEVVDAAPTPAPPPVARTPPPPLPTSDVRHCPTCGSEFTGSRVVCSDCATTLVDGPSPRFDPDAATEDTPLSDTDFVPLATLSDGQAADVLCHLLADAGVATITMGRSGKRLHAPGHEAIGPVTTGGSVEVRVFPEDLARAGDVIADWSDQDAILERLDDDARPSESTPPASSRPVVHVAPEDPGDPLATFRIVMFVAGVSALVAAWVLWR